MNPADMSIPELLLERTFCVGAPHVYGGAIRAAARLQDVEAELERRNHPTFNAAALVEQMRQEGAERPMTPDD